MPDHSHSMRRWPRAALVAALGAGFACASLAQYPQPSMRLVSETPVAASQSALSAEELQDIAVDAYLYAYPMVLMEATRRASTQVQTSLAGKAPMNQFGHRTVFPDPGATDVAWPSTDMLYSSLWYDVSRQPLIIRVPDSGGRYYAMSLLDMWTDEYASRGTRTTGNGEQTFAIVGPHWQGTAPFGVEVVRSPTSMGWLIARIQTGGQAEYAAVNQFQAGMTASPMAVAPSAPTLATPPRRGAAKPATWPQSPSSPGYTPIGAPSTLPAPVSTVTWSAQGSPGQQVAAMDPATFFTVFAELLRANPPHANDYAMLSRLRRIGLVGPQPFSYSRLDPAVQQALADALPVAGRRIADAVPRLGTSMNGWNTVLTGIGTYGTDYTRRAAVAYAGLGATTPHDALYPVTTIDDDGELLRSDEEYVLHFDKGQLPPANAAWSLILYNADHNLAPNRIGRYALRSTDPLQYNADGSLDIYIQRDDPGPRKAANWLPAPDRGNFMLNMRLYWPRDIALDGNWAPPPVRED
ncbi:DUF1254 domain-containing protein [Bordetella petrii]|uniref:DUF1254 domain-containing protein n=1 Tax=Bordetella petrii TaxID=94624 RepID=UPI003F52D9CF